MKSLFSKTGKASTNLKHPSARNLVQHLSGKVENTKRVISEQLQIRTNKYTKRRKLTVLVLLTLLLSSYNIWLVGSGLFSRSSSRIEYGSLSSSLNDLIISAKAHPGHGRIDEGRYRQLMKFKDSLNALAHNPSTINEYRKILSNRPGMLDSLTLLQELYESLNKPHD